MTVAFAPVAVVGKPNPVITEPVTDVRLCATIFAFLPIFKYTTTWAFGAKPLPTTPTWPPGDTRPGFSMTSGPPPAAIRWPPIVTVGIGDRLPLELSTVTLLLATVP